MDTTQIMPSITEVVFLERCGDLGRAMVMYLSTAIAAIRQTAATMDMWVMKFVTRQKLEPKTQSLESGECENPSQIEGSAELQTFVRQDNCPSELEIELISNIFNNPPVC